jgi:hypothetical protein
MASGDGDARVYDAAGGDMWGLVGSVIGERLYPLLARQYGLAGAGELWLKELVVIKYQPRLGTPLAAPPTITHAAPDGVARHRDSSVLSFNVLLSLPTDFAGGGTLFPSMAADTGEARSSDGGTGGSSRGSGDSEQVAPVMLGQGDAVLHSGKVEHEGVAVSAGTRYVLAGFVQVCALCGNQSNVL